MTAFDESFLSAVAIGAGATVVMDMWLLLLKRLNVPGLNFALLGRWAGHMLRGRVAHQSIAQAEPVPFELALGWATHYLTGVGFAVLLQAIAGASWVQAPTLLPAVAFGLGTVIFPWFVMQPAMGAGIASSRTKTPVLNCFRNLVNHAVFGFGLYAAATAASTFALL